MRELSLPVCYSAVEEPKHRVNDMQTHIHAHRHIHTGDPDTQASICVQTHTHTYILTHSLALPILTPTY